MPPHGGRMESYMLKTSFDPKAKTWLSNASQRLPNHDLYYGTPLNKPYYGIPMGDGDMGSLVWQERDGIHINIGKCDLWKDASPGVTPDDEVMNGSKEEEQTIQKHGGEIVIRFENPAFDYMYQKEYEMRLSLSDATVSMHALTPMGLVESKAFASAAEHVSAIRCKITSEEGDAPEIRLLRWGSRSMWRWYSHHIFKPEIGLDGTESYAENDRLFITQDIGTTKFCLGLALVTDSEIDRTVRKNCHEASIDLVRAKEHEFTLYYTIRIADTVENAKILCAEALEKTIGIGFDYMYKKHAEEWADFWSKSHVAIPDNYLENTYYLYLYYMNSGNRGAYPMRFIHGPWGFYHDFEPWAYYFHYNMQQLFAPLDASGHGELAQNYYNLRRNSLETAKLFAKKVKGKKGSFFHDVTDRYGRGAGYDSDNHTCGAQMSMEMWHHWKYTGDKDFLNNYALPMMKASVEYYLDILEKGEDGLYHTRKTCGYEGNVLMDDTITDLAMMKILFRTYRDYADDELRVSIDDVLAHMTDYVLAPMEQERDLDGDVVGYGIGKGRKPEGKGLIYTVGLNDEGKRMRKHTGNDKSDVPAGKVLFPYIEFAPLYPSGDLGLKDKGTDKFDAMKNQLYITSSPLDGGMQWRMTTVFMARMGMGEDLYKTAREMMDTFQSYPNGFNAEQEEPACKPPFQSPQWYRPHNPETGKRYKLCPDDFTHFSFETVPIVSKAINESLLQSHEGIIRICPAIPSDDSVSFSLYAEGGFKVNAEVTPDSYVITLENLCGNGCYVTVPEYVKASNLYAYKALDGGFSPVEIKTSTVGNETALDFSDSIKGETILLASSPIEELETAIPETLKLNNDMKECGKAHLGSPHLMYD